MKAALQLKRVITDICTRHNFNLDLADQQLQLIKDDGQDVVPVTIEKSYEDHLTIWTCARSGTDTEITVWMTPNGWYTISYTQENFGMIVGAVYEPDKGITAYKGTIQSSITNEAEQMARWLEIFIDGAERVG